MEQFYPCHLIIKLIIMFFQVQGHRPELLHHRGRSRGPVVVLGGGGRAGRPRDRQGQVRPLRLLPRQVWEEVQNGEFGMLPGEPAQVNEWKNDTRIGPEHSPSNIL